MILNGLWTMPLFCHVVNLVKQLHHTCNWIERLEMENEEDRLRNAISEWERENHELNYGEEQYGWDFREEHV